MDANEILGVAANAGDEEIRAEFEKIRDAYETMRDPRRRARAMFSAGESGAPLVSLIEGRGVPRIFAGPQPWREVLKNK